MVGRTDGRTTDWRPDLSRRPGPLYLAIVDALESDIRTRALATGAQLPTHRALARSLNVTLSTVTRAYREARERGLIEGETGRGTFVRDRSVRGRSGRAGESDSAVIDLMVNQPPIGALPGVLGDALKRLAGSARVADLMGYGNSAGLERHREAGARWVARAGVTAGPGNVIVCCGAQQALFAAMSASLSAGDLAATERLNYAGIRRIADLLGITLEAIAMDRGGIDPDAFEDACRRRPVRALIVTPNLHNPTTAVLDLERRKALVATAQRHGVRIIEDDVSGPLLEAGLPPLHGLAETEAAYVSGTAKSIYPGLRIGYLVVPENQYQRHVDPVHTSSWGAPALMAEIASAWIDDGTVDAFIDHHRRESAERARLAASILGDRLHTCRGGYHGWLELPDGWRPEEFATLARLDGVAVAPSSMFTLSGVPPAAVRISLGSVDGLHQLRVGLERLGDLMERRPAAAIV